jgi:hypothetical protein
MSDTWIATASGKRPEQGQSVMFARPSGVTFMGSYIKGLFYVGSNTFSWDEVTHWLPLPSLPTASQEEGTNG